MSTLASSLTLSLEIFACSLVDEEGYDYQNHIDVLTSLEDPTKQFILRVLQGEPYEAGETCAEIEDSVCVSSLLKSTVSRA